MEDMQNPVAKTDEGSLKPMSFDDYLGQLPQSKQTTHKILGPLILVFMVLVVGSFLYGLYASFRWQVVGETQVVVAWMLYFLAAGLGLMFYGLDTVNLGSTLPLPWSGGVGSQYESEPKAVQTGWRTFIGGILLSALAGVGIVLARAGVFTLENWIQVIVGIAVLTGFVGIMQAVVQTIRSRQKTA